MDTFNATPIIVCIINGKGGCGKDTIISNLDPNRFYVMSISTVDKVKKAAEILGWDPSKKDDVDRKFLHDMKMLATKYNDSPNEYVIKAINHVVYWINMLAMNGMAVMAPDRTAETERRFYHASFVDDYLADMLKHTPEVKRIITPINKVIYAQVFEDLKYQAVNPDLTPKIPVLFIHCREPESITDLVRRIRADFIETHKGVVLGACLVTRDVTDGHVYGNHCDDDVEQYNDYDFVIHNDDLSDAVRELAQKLEDAYPIYTG